MRNVTTYSGLKKELERIRDKALKETSKDVVELAKDRVDKDVYEVGEPSVYSRSYQLRDSLFTEDIQRSKSSASIVIRHNWEDMECSVDANRYYSPKWSPNIYTKYIAQTVHDGTSGSRFGFGFWMRPRPYMDNAKTDLISGEYRKFMVNRLTGMGYKVL